MSEIDILRKMAKAALVSQEYKEKYDSAMREWQASHPFADQRRSKQVFAERSKTIAPLYEKYKFNKKKFEGYLFMWSQL